MIIISKSILHQFAGLHNDVKDALDDWYRKTRRADWSSFKDIKETFNSVDFVGNDRFVFNIKGNKYRLVAMIHFDRRTLYIRFIGTHSDYDDIDCSVI
jgi:mRNA interferase HigB